MTRRLPLHRGVGHAYTTVGAVYTDLFSSAIPLSWRGPALACDATERLDHHSPRRASQSRALGQRSASPPHPRPARNLLGVYVQRERVTERAQNPCLHINDLQKHTRFDRTNINDLRKSTQDKERAK
jgi:hypothetical protein